MPVLDARMEPDAVTAAAELRVQRRHDRVALLTRQMARREVDHGAVDDGDEIAPERDLLGTELDTHRGGLDRRPTGVELRGVVTEDREIADVAARRQAGRDHLGASDLPSGRERGESGHASDLERRPTVELGHRLVGAAVGDEHEVPHVDQRTRGRGHGRSR